MSEYSIVPRASKYATNGEAPQSDRLLEIDRHLCRLDISVEGKAYVKSVAEAPPSRSAGTHRNRNLVLAVPIPSLGVVLQAESASGEYNFILEMMRRRDVIALYDQPVPVHFTITNRRGIRTPIRYTPDFLAILKDRVVVYEVKADAALEELCASRPDDWHRTIDGYQYLPATQYYGALGIHHQTVPNSVTSAIRAENLRLLAAVQRIQDNDRLKKRRSRALEVVKKRGAIRLQDLLNELKVVDASAVFQLIESGELFANLDTSFLSSFADTWVGLGPETIRAVAVSRARIGDALADGTSVSTEEVPDPAYLGEIARRYALCESSKDVIEDMHGSRSPRTLSRYRKAYRESGGDIRSLAPQWHKCGNRTRRKSDEHLAVLHGSIREAKGDPNLSTPANAYVAYLSKIKANPQLAGEMPVKRPTMYRHWNAFGISEEDERARGGRRKANASASSINPNLKTLIPARSFELAHIDHCLADIELILGVVDRKVLTQRPWITAMVDAYSGEVLSIWVSFRSPCRESCSMAIRDCVRRNGRLPEVLVMDGGPDFESVHFTTMLAMLGVTRASRPPEDPRFGKEVERFFGSFKECFSRGMPGFVEGPINARKVSGSFTPSRRAELQLGDLLERLDAYVYGGYNKTPKPGTLTSRQNIRLRSDMRHPYSGISVEWDARFLVQTSVEAPSASYSISPSRGIRVMDRWYTSNLLLNYRGFKKNVSVRIDPFDDSVIYVCFGGAWHVCWSSCKLENGATSEAEVLTKTAEHQQLRSLRRIATDEAWRYAYELKMADRSSASSIPDTQNQEHPLRHAPAKNDRKKSRKRNLDQIEDLSMDEVDQ